MATDNECSSSSASDSLLTCPGSPMTLNGYLLNDPTDITSGFGLIALNANCGDASLVQYFPSGNTDSWTTTIESKSPSSSYGGDEDETSASDASEDSSEEEEEEESICNSRPSPIVEQKNESQSSSCDEPSSKSKLSYTQSSIHDSDTVFDLDLLTDISFQPSDYSSCGCAISTTVQQSKKDNKKKLGFKIRTRRRFRQKIRRLPSNCWSENQHQRNLLISATWKHPRSNAVTQSDLLNENQ